MPKSKLLQKRGWGVSIDAVRKEAVRLESVIKAGKNVIGDKSKLAAYKWVLGVR